MKTVFAKDRTVFELTVVDKDVLPLVLFFPERPASRNGEICVITSTWVVFLANEEIEVGGKHFSTTEPKEGAFHYSKSLGIGWF